MRRVDFSTFRYAALLVLLLGFFNSCENQVFLPPYETEQSGELSASIKAGALIGEEQEIQLALENDRDGEDQPESLEIEILDRDQKSLGVQTLTGEELEGELLRVSLDGLGQGFHTLQMRLYDDQGELVNEIAIPFFKVNSFPIIQRIELYPPDAVFPEASGILVPSISGGTGTWLRWTMDDDLLACGLYEEFRDGFVWTAPQQEGVYSVALEVFPQEPLDSEAGYPFESPIKSEVQFFVQAEVAGLKGELGPDTDFRNVFHLRGALNDSGYAPANLKFEGSPVLAVIDGVFGYRLTAEDSLLVDGVFLADADTGLPEAFSVKVIWRPVSGNFSEKHVASFLGADGKPLMIFVSDESSYPHITLPKQPQIDTGIRGAGLDSCREFAVSFIPDASDVLIKWYCNGRLRGVDVVQGKDFPSLTDAVFKLGGKQNGYTGFEGLIDEFGIYSAEREGRALADTAIFHKWADRNIGERTVLYAEGYESYRDDALRIQAGEKKRLVDIPPEWESAYVSIFFTEDNREDSGYIELSAGKGAVFRLPFEKYEELLSDDGHSVEGWIGFTLRRTGEKCTVESPAGVKIYEEPSWFSSVVRMDAGSLGEKGDLRVSELLITKEQTPYVADRGGTGADKKVVQ